MPTHEKLYIGKKVTYGGKKYTIGLLFDDSVRLDRGEMCTFTSKKRICRENE